MELVKEIHGYATRANALKKLVAEGVDLKQDRWLIANTAEGRYQPVLVGVRYIDYVYRGISVVE